MIQPLRELEKWHKKNDPWVYKNSAEDRKRKHILLSEIPDKHYKRVLDIGCGQGFITQSLPGKQVVGVDISKEAIKKAKKTERKGLKYFRGSIFDLGALFKEKFDLIVNIAALHHTQFINRVSRVLAKSLDPNGIFVNYDYIGPHRNQYPLLQWLLAQKVNNTLPGFFKQDLRYPHIPTMLVTDPTEAIHSELIIESVKRYFHILERNDTGGGIAYLLLTHNAKINKLPIKRANTYIEQVLRYDEKYTKLKLTPPLFSYFIARPNKEVIKDKEMTLKFQIIEDKRERLVSKKKGHLFFY